MKTAQVLEIQETPEVSEGRKEKMNTLPPSPLRLISQEMVTQLLQEKPPTFPRPREKPVPVLKVRYVLD